MSVGHELGILGMETFGIGKLVIEMRWGIARSLPLSQHVGEVSELVT